MKRSILIVVALGLIMMAGGCAARGTLDALSLNILFSEYPQRSQRLADIAAFVAENNVQLIALQEVVGGELDNLVAQRLGGDPVDGNTAQELRNLLRQNHGLECDLRTGFATGVPALYEVSNAMLVCGWQFTGYKIVRLLTPADEGVKMAGYTVKLTRSVLMTRLTTESGSVNIYNTHLCSLCGQQERLTQVTEALTFIDQVESLIPANHVIFLGDFNSVMGDPVYSHIISRDFTDTYAHIKRISLQNGIDPSCTLVNTVNIQGCTIGVSEVPDPLFGFTDPPLRIDYVFAKGPWTLEDSTVVFNPKARDGEGPSVSDHSGVRTSFGPP
jgi:endonuclease/exonuclease/phosphatase family metal-dependent hydrolase